MNIAIYNYPYRPILTQLETLLSRSPDVTLIPLREIKTITHLQAVSLEYDLDRVIIDFWNPLLPLLASYQKDFGTQFFGVYTEELTMDGTYETFCIDRLSGLWVTNPRFTIPPLPINVLRTSPLVMKSLARQQWTWNPLVVFPFLLSAIPIEQYVNEWREKEFGQSLRIIPDAHKTVCSYRELFKNGGYVLADDPARLEELLDIVEMGATPLFLRGTFPDELFEEQYKFTTCQDALMRIASRILMSTQGFMGEQYNAKQSSEIMQFFLS